MRRTLTFAILAAFVLAGPVSAAELARFTITEPLGIDWTDEWLTYDLTVKKLPLPDLATLALAAAPEPAKEGKEPPPPEVVPAQFLPTRHKGGVRVLFRTSLKKNQTITFTVTDGAKMPPTWPHVAITEKGGRTIVSSGMYEVEFDAKKPLPMNAMRAGSAKPTMGAFRWPKGIEPTGVTDVWYVRGPARSLLKRTFQFKDLTLAYEILFDFRAGDPWINVCDKYALTPGAAVTLDLSPLGADVVYHPHTYNARTFKHDGKAEDTTLEPPQHAIATLGPIWRDIWFGGGPFAFIYKTGADHGVGLAAVRGSQWRSVESVSLESQNLFVHGDKEKPGQVRVRIPTDAGERHWAFILGPPDLRKDLSRMTRSHADIPLDTVLSQWVLDWKSDAPAVSHGMAGVYLGGHFNQHSFNPTTFPRRVRSGLPKKGPVKSRDLAVLAYIFSNPDYWPGPAYRWKIGNPNFHTDMYSIPLAIGLVMPDHPHARRWVEQGVEETRGNVYRDSFGGGAWAESLSYSGFFFHVVENARKLRDAGAAQPFKDWPRIKEIATYLACMHTPTDPRYGSRQKAPIGDTHPGNYVEQLNAMADVYRGTDDLFAEQLAKFPAKWDKALDLSSREFYGFGAMLRGHPYDDRHESFVTIKAGPARNHYQGDELSFHFCALGTPLAIDYACHYSPRPWSAAIHNRPDMNGKRPVAVAARRAFAASDAADVFVADERTTLINHVPMEPHLATKPGWEYPETHLPDDKAWTMRRWTMLVKHDPATSKIADYLVIRDEIASPEPVWWNLHMLARTIDRKDGTALFPGQLDVDTTAHFLAPPFKQAECRQWGWKNVNSGDLRTTKGTEYEEKYFGAYIPETFERGTWNGGEMAQWLRWRGDAGRTNWLVVLAPHLRGTESPKVERLSDTSARVTLGNETEVVHLGSDGKHQAAVERGSKTRVLLKAGEVKPWSEVEFKPVPPGADQGAR